jgi:AraC-like DNA-binding protein
LEDEAHRTMTQVSRTRSARERRVINLAEVGIPDVPALGRYEYHAVRPGLASHRHPGCVEICYLARGCQTYRAGGREYRLVGGDVFVTAPGEEHDTGGEPEDCGVLYWLILDVSLTRGTLLMLSDADSAEVAYRLAHLLERRFAGRPVLKRIFQRLFDLHDQRDDSLRRVAIANQLVRCVLEVLDCASRHQGPRCSPEVLAIVDRICSNPEEEFHLTDLAGQMHLSLSRFKARFKAETGIAPHEFILRTKVDAARKVLLGGRTSITDTAMQFGFGSAGYFATVFKRFTNQTPHAFRAGGTSALLRDGNV